jgi:hypothetical protein
MPGDLRGDRGQDLLEAVASGDVTHIDSDGGRSVLLASKIRAGLGHA